MRYFVQFSYFGKAYHGWQNQPNAITVQEVLEKALSTLLREKVEVVGAGRTDAGVHAKQMFCHMDVDSISDIDELVYRLNAFLPDDIAVQAIFPVIDTAHARFDAIERTYEYWLVKEKSPFLFDYAHLVKHPLNLPSMNRAAQLMLNYTDFECFSKSNTDVKTFKCDVREAVWTVDKEKWVFTITADRFLRNMVRAVVGTLLDVGQGKISPEDIHKIIASKDRGEAGVSVPAKGLYLTKVSYPKEIFDEQKG
ncbi:MAG TPA: tRNA pseudouridine(38-40) synthase TruA [Muricauda sp.]|uniref:tRNA pseudouridine synthase A n=1 Tax=Flagellimonas aurea TaxID=2915619 RepID=A0ABS3G3I6_9FLAO|nr:tRNA pseudouridine(38-40) synthase TruA [Allomuricauda aurea]MBO0353935.1 tRNA pseudouridine(38-40) synthase TruA [Allomuricauda aurea]UBZ14895.1 tRNA pseudouridine(38-40) synthase TruA [Allomuricauda aquimarina]HBU78073.1 tRNA pseudouridine(38-40) synthase TruA [Allomuricauda sp.]